MYRLAPLLFAAALPVASLAQPPKADPAKAAAVRAEYTKFEYRIPMRDEVRLFTRVYVPKDDSQPWPIVLTRTPYALKPYGANNYTEPSGSFTSTFV